MAFLMDGKLEPGTPVSIDGMARDLGVSPTPIREALARLEATGMVARIALKGYRVAPLFMTEELGKLMEARRVIETANASMACSNATPELCTELEKTIIDLREAPRGVHPFPSFAASGRRMNTSTASLPSTLTTCSCSPPTTRSGAKCNGSVFSEVSVSQTPT
jgi:DNA-binding GntR family transcriptional regulator